jgi:CDP-diacylglycerol--glycerol-3-phosphate 3-phosphatidyltransferase
MFNSCTGRDAYSLIEKEFLQRASKSPVSVVEYNRPGWSYHAKGLWLYHANDALPFMTVIGSPNFGQRSSQRDLEAQVVVVSRSKALRQRWHDVSVFLYSKL